MLPSDKAPYPGLRAFKREETHLFFGRDGCVETMVEQLGRTHFLAVLGSSGTGKSSLVQTGLISGLEMGLLGLAKSRWRVVDFRPRGEPLHNLARRLLATEGRDSQNGSNRPDEGEVGALRARLKREPWALFRWCQEGHLPRGTNLLILVDQFEELFRYQTYDDREEAEAFVARLLEVRNPPEFLDVEAAASLYVTITMRSEYLGACSLIENLAEAINQGAYLTPRMKRNECREAIEGPAELCGIEIEEALVNRLLNDLARFAFWGDDGKNEPGQEDQLSRLARRADQLPLMQHALNRMWEEARTGLPRSDQREHPENPGSIRLKLTLAGYEKIGGLEGALDKHADAVLAGLAGRLGEKVANATASAIFRAVTMGTKAADAVRHPTKFGALVTICGGEAHRAAARDVVDAFRSEGCNFLQPEVDSNNRRLADGDFVDITHESLIRQWTRLREWAREEFESAENYRRLEDAAKRHEKGKVDLWTKAELANALAWRDRESVNEAWAARYGDSYKLAIAFLRDSEEAERRDAAVAREQEKQKAIAGFKAKWRWGAVAVTVAVLFGGLVLYLTQQRAIINRNYETAVASAQSLLDQVRESLNRGDITTNGALGMLATASNIVQRVPKSETLASAALFANLEWTACDIYFSLGDLNEAYSRAKRARDFVEPFYEARPSDPETLRAVYFSTWRMADAISHRGLDREYQLRALPLYAEAERLARLLMDKSPEDRAWQRELVFVLGKLGDVRLGLREWTRAIETYREAVPIMRAVADSQPDNRGWQRDLADAVARVGDGLSANRQFDEALAPLEEALEIRKNLAARYRDDATIQGSVAIGRGRIARLYERWGRPGDLDLALEQYRIAIEVLEILLGRDSANAFWQNLVAPWYSQSGALLIKKGELTAALAQYQKAYPLRRALALRDPIPARQYESADAAIKVANLLVELKSLSEAVRIYREAVETLDEVRPKYDLDVFQIHIKIGDVLAMQGELPNALTEYETASDIARKAAAADPTSGPWQKVLEESYLKIGEFLIRQGRPRDALDHYQKALKFVDELAAKHADVGAWATLAQRLKAEIAKLT